MNVRIIHTEKHLEIFLVDHHVGNITYLKVDLKKKKMVPLVCI